MLEPERLQPINLWPLAERKGREMTDPGLSRAVERVSLACKALSAAGNDLAIASRRDGLPVEGVAADLEVERERLCGVAEALGELAWKLSLVPAA
jgi:hypothetical protein